MAPKIVLLRIFGLMAVLFLSACASVPITSIYKLRNFNPVTTNIESLRIAVRIPDGIHIMEGGVQFMMGSEHHKRASLQETFVLEQFNGPTNLEGLHLEETHTHAFQIAHVDIKRLKRLQRDIQIEKTHGADGILAVTADVCYGTPEMPSRIPISTYVNVSETNGYVALMKNMDVLNPIFERSHQRLVPQCTSK